MHFYFFRVEVTPIICTDINKRPKYWNDPHCIHVFTVSFKVPPGVFLKKIFLNTLFWVLLTGCCPIWGPLWIKISWNLKSRHWASQKCRTWFSLFDKAWWRQKQRGSLTVLKAHNPAGMFFLVLLDNESVYFMYSFIRLSGHGHTTWLRKILLPLQKYLLHEGKKPKWRNTEAAGSFSWI